MTIKLLQFFVNTESDLLTAHDISLRIARWAGMTVIDQIHFAAAVSDSCFHNTGNEVTFYVAEQENGEHSLQAKWCQSEQLIEKGLGRQIVVDQLPLFKEVTQEKRDHSEKGYKDMQQFTFALAHDLKNSLTKLNLALTLVDEEQLPSSVVTYMQIIHRAVARLQEITLSLNKILVVGHSSPDVVRLISPADVFADVQEEFADTLRKMGATVNTDFFLVPQLNYIEVYLKSIFSNLLSNSIKYASPARPLKVSLTAHRQGNQAAFIYSDNGSGIDLEVHGPRLFQPFNRFSSHVEGSGIGLYLIKNIIERNGGKIEVDSKPGYGTTFRFYLKEYELPFMIKKAES